MPKSSSKKSAVDDRKKNEIDENIFTACRIIASAYRTADVTSTTVRGYVQVIGEMPFCAHLFSEQQIQRYIDYCKKPKYSYVHIDATGGILKQMREQNQTKLYAIVFKDGTNSINTIPLAHALLTDHTIPSISYFLGNLAHQIKELKSELVLPSFFVIDFSATVMNSILKEFNEENIDTHLNRCWNVLNGNYNSIQLRSLSFIHLCCSHVIKAIARSLNAVHRNKTIRRGVLHIFAFILCGNNLRQLYDILGLVIDIFGDPYEQNAREKFDKMLSLKLDVDEESVTLLSDHKKILKEARKANYGLKVVDEYFRANIDIIHQSPFNTEAIRRFPNLTTVINSKLRYDKVINPLYSPALIRIFYRWWAYLPLWTGLLWNFKERYSNSHQTNTCVIYNPVHHSNTVIESYFHVLKQSILKKKIKTQPHKVIEEIHRSMKVQFQALEYGVTQSSKGKKRKKSPNGEWNKKRIGPKRRNSSVRATDAFAAVDGGSKMKNTCPNEDRRKNSESETASTVSSPSESSITSNELDDNICSNNSDSESSPSKPVAMVSGECLLNVRVNSHKPTFDDQPNKSLVKFDFDDDDINNNNCSIANRKHPVDNQPTSTTGQPSHQSEALIDGHRMQWPRFGIKNAMFRGRFYTLTNTCSIDSALFALYFIYQPDKNVAQKLKEAPDKSPYSTLMKVCHTVDNEGWDAARLSWLHEHHILENAAQKEDLFGSVDEQVFRFLTHEQRYSYQIECSRAECKNKIRTRTATELTICTFNDYIREFHNETDGVCDVVMADSDEMTPEEAHQHNYRNGPLVMIDGDINTDEDQSIWICNAITRVSLARFTNDASPPIIIANIIHLANSSENQRGDCHPQLSNLKREIRINSMKYKLRAVIHHTDKPFKHFTATLIGTGGHLYFYDDMDNEKQGQTSTDPVIYGIYSQVYTFDD